MITAALSLHTLNKYEIVNLIMDLSGNHDGISRSMIAHMNIVNERKFNIPKDRCKVQRKTL